MPSRRSPPRLTTRRGRIALLTLAGVGWLGVVVGAASGLMGLVAGGAVLAGVANMVVVKLALEEWAASRRTGLTIVALDAGARAAVGRWEAMAERIDLHDDRLNEHAARLGGQDSRLSEHAARIGDGHDALVELRAAAGRAGLAAEVERLDGQVAVNRAALAMTRGLVEEIGRRVGAPDPARLERAARRAAAAPRLSIAVPAFNRPDELAECLASIERVVDEVPRGAVEVCILDDASFDPRTTDVELDFVERHDFVSLRRQSTNLGIERNVLAAAAECRGDFVLLLGCDDGMLAGSLGVILGDIDAVGASVYVYEKRRTTADGQPREPVAGSSPVELPPGEGYRFGSLLEATARQGPFSTFGFISTIVFRRAPFVAVDASPFVGLTMYPHVFVLVEAFGAQPVFYRNVPTAFHRTASQSHKLAEGIGRREEVFMEGGRRKSAQYFGTTLAAAWQRSVDRGSVDHRFLVNLPERLMTPLPLVEWIRRNRLLDPSLDDRLDPRVVDDAERFGAARELSSTQ